MTGPARQKILIVDDEPDILQFLNDALTDEGYEVLVAHDGPGVFRQLADQLDLIILDVMIPGMDGVEVCRAIRSRVASPILFLSALGNEDDRIRGLLAGGDDYVVKPFSVRELVARIKAHLRAEQRRKSRPGRTTLHDGELTVDIVSYEVYLPRPPAPFDGPGV